jgi:hypothetical protein
VGRLASDKALGRDTFFGNLDTICVFVDSSVKEFHPGAFVGNIRVAIDFGLIACYLTLRLLVRH